jgi:hypothetical protein
MVLYQNLGLYPLRKLAYLFRGIHQNLVLRCPVPVLGNLCPDDEIIPEIAPNRRFI